MKKKKTHKKRLKIFILLLLFMCTGSLLLLTPLFNIQEIAVAGNSKVTHEAIISVSNIMLGTNIFRVNLGEAKSGVKSLAYIDSIEIRRRFPSTISIEVKESRVEAYVPFIGNVVGIDRNAKILETVSGSENVDLPIFRGVTISAFNIGESIKTDNERKLEAIKKYIEAMKTHNLSLSIKEIDLSNPEDIIINYLNKLTIKLGGVDKLSYKLSYLLNVTAKMEEQGEIPHGTLDMRNQGTAVYRAEMQ